jgi:hypothetical protein
VCVIALAHMCVCVNEVVVAVQAPGTMCARLQG